MRRDVLLTGYGVHTVHGRGADAVRGGVFAGRPAFTPVTRFDTAPYRASAAATVPDPPSLVDVVAGCARDALAAAGSGPGGDVPFLLGCLGDADAVTRFWRDGPGPDTAYASPGAVADAVADACDLAGPRIAYSNACVASSTAVIHGWRLIASGRADTVVCAGGYLVDEPTFGQFDSGRALSRDDAMRPFCADRGGMLLGDGAAVVVLDSSDAARRRGAAPLARLTGCAAVSEAYHVAKPHPEGVGVTAAVRQAMRAAGLAPEDVDYVNAHGVASPLADRGETRGLRAAFGAAADTVPVSSTKGTTGHLLAATGAVELVISLLALTDGVLPPTAGYTTGDPECDLDFITDGPRETAVRRVLSLNAAFGGMTTALLLERP